MSVVPRPTMRERLAAGETLVGTFLGLGSAVAAEACGRAGVDWLLIDLEHGAGGEEALPAQLIGARAAGVHGLCGSRPRSASGRPGRWTSAPRA